MKSALRPAILVTMPLAFCLALCLALFCALLYGLLRAAALPVPSPQEIPGKRV